MEEATPNPEPSDPVATLLSEIKDESGRQKYADVTVALNALKSTQEYIPTLKQKINDLEQKASMFNEMNTVEQLLNSIQPPAPEPQEQITPDPAEPEEQVSLEDKFKEFLAKERLEQAKQQNLQSVNTKLAEMFGDKQQEMYETKAKELGVNKEFLDAMAQKSPNAVLEYFKKSTPVSVTPESTMNTTSPGFVPPKEKVKNVMYGASSAEVDAAWKACAPQ